MSAGATGGGEAEGPEDRFDAALAQRARVEQADQEAVPVEVVRRLSGGEAPLTVWREHRGLSRAELAAAAQVPAELLAEVEGGRGDVKLRLMHAIARALSVDLDDLVPWPMDGDDAAGPPGGPSVEAPGEPSCRDST